MSEIQKIGAILTADVIGYSWLAGKKQAERPEGGRASRGSRRNLVDPCGCFPTTTLVAANAMSA